MASSRDRREPIEALLVCRVSIWDAFDQPDESRLAGFPQWILRVVVAGAFDLGARDDERLKIEIRAAHQRTRETYGTRRRQPELAASGVHAGRVGLPVYAAP